MKKKYIILAIILILFIEGFRGVYYRFQLKKSYIDVIDYIETNHRIDEDIVFQLENQNVKLEYSINGDDIDIKLTKKHIIFFVIDTNITINQKYILSRLNK